jgi:hypothetical protein
MYDRDDDKQSRAIKTWKVWREAAFDLQREQAKPIYEQPRSRMLVSNGGKKGRGSSSTFTLSFGNAKKGEYVFIQKRLGDFPLVYHREKGYIWLVELP